MFLEYSNRFVVHFLIRSVRLKIRLCGIILGYLDSSSPVLTEYALDVTNKNSRGYFIYSQICFPMESEVKSCTTKAHNLKWDKSFQRNRWIIWKSVKIWDELINYKMQIIKKAGVVNTIGVNRESIIRKQNLPMTRIWK